MKAWWSGLSAREQGLIAVAAALGALLLLTQIVIRPVVGWRSATAQRAEQAESGYRLVAQAAALAPTSTKASAEISAANALTETARRMNVNLNFVNEHPDGSIEFQAGPVDAERAFALFAALERGFAVRAIAVDMARSPESPHLVRLQATLSR